MATAVHPVPATTRVTIELDLADALGVGHSIVALARQARTPEGTKAIYERVGKLMVNAGREAILRAGRK
jgi:hypothetical protein